MKFYIKDEDGKEYEVEEVAEKTTDEETLPPVEEKTTDEDVNALTADEITALKSLAANADRIIALLDTEEAEHEATEDEEPVIEDEDEDETIVDTDEEMENTCHDSKRSVGAIEKGKVLNDSIEVQDSIAAAWAKRYSNKGGNE